MAGGREEKKRHDKATMSKGNAAAFPFSDGLHLQYFHERKVNSEKPGFLT
jgi:hypothetical protein